MHGPQNVKFNIRYLTQSWMLQIRQPSLMYVFLQLLPAVSELLSNVRRREVNQGGIVSTVTRLWTEQSGVQILTGASDFFYLWTVQTSCKDHLASLSISTRDPSQEYEQHRHEIDHSASYSAVVKHEWSYTSTLPICLMVWRGTTSLFKFWCFADRASQNIYFSN